LRCLCEISTRIQALEILILAIALASNMEIAIAQRIYKEIV
jgi:hypothetical protein